MTVEEAKEIAMSFNGLAMDYKERALVVLMLELERVTTKLGESLPNDGFCVKNCKNSMKPTLKHDTV